MPIKLFVEENLRKMLLSLFWKHRKYEIFKYLHCKNYDTLIRNVFKQTKLTSGYIYKSGIMWMIKHPLINLENFQYILSKCYVF